MDVTKVRVNSLFEPSVQYRIPLFQRHYVWDEENQWQFLWDDIRKSQSLQEKDSSLHFTGAIVVQQKATPAGDVPKYEIIDGQQRLTTFQIILCAIRNICKLHGYDDIASDISRYIQNQGMLLSKDERFKLIPTELDRPAFISLVEEREDESTGRIHLAYHYFRNKIANHTKGEQEKVLSLFRSILNYFGFVQILIDDGDRPEKIFESLNARGKSLLQFDLLRNDLFLRASEDRDTLYEKYWTHFEDVYWDPEEKSGTSCELFLQHFLMAKLATEGVKPEFNVYQRRYCEKLSNIYGIEHEFSELKRYSETYKEMTDCADDSEIGKRMKFYQIFDLTTLHPFILFIRCEVGLSGNELKYVFDILESYTIRRMLCCGGKRGLLKFNIFFSGLIRNLRNDFSLENFRERLCAETSNTNKDPTDKAIQPALHTYYEEHSTLFPDDSTIVFPDNYSVKAALDGLWSESAGAIRKRLIRYILYRIELMKIEENRFTEPLIFRDDLTTLEHVMPSEWKKTWHLPVADGVIDETQIGGYPSIYVNRDVEGTECLYENLFRDPKKPSRKELINDSYLDAFNLALARDNVLQSIGNLTLVTRELNTKLKNHPFPEKKADLDEYSSLRLNKEICQYDAWDVNEICARAEKLIADVCKIWPSLDWFAENIK